MLTCRSCMPRHLGIFLGHPQSTRIAIRSRSTIDISRTNFRTHSVAAIPFGEITDRDVVTPSKDAKRDGTFGGGRRDARQVWLDSRGVRPAHKQKAPKDAAVIERDVNRELEFLKDPLKLADAVRLKLRDKSHGKDTLERVLMLVRGASKDMECVVSWNHIINYQMTIGKVKAAVKTFNEMKKRAQRPDAHTYTLIFRGLADNTQNPTAIAHALSIYESMQAENAPVKPNITHTNAVLKVCSRSGNMDALFGIAAKMPERGINQPNNLTFTTIFNAVRLSAVSSSLRRVSPTKSQELNRKAVDHARRIWVDVITRWRKAEMWIDEELVCAAGRVLLIGEEPDWDDVLSLVEQSMNIPRLLPRKGTAERDAIEPGCQGKTAVEPTETADDGVPITNNPEEDVFRLVKPPKAPRGDNGTYAVPGANTFGMVMDALSLLGSKAAAKKYWDVFIDEYYIKPDAQIVHQYLRILRWARSSSEVVEVLLKLPDFDAYSTTIFRLALSACERDKNNQNVFANAGKILDLMQQKLVKPDPRSLSTYLEVALSAKAFSDKIAFNGQHAESKFAQGRQILRALHRLQPAFAEIRSQLAYGDPLPPDPRTDHRFARDKEKTNFDWSQDALAFVRKMISAYDKLMNNAMVARESCGPLVKERSLLAAFVTRHMKKFPTDGMKITRKGPMPVPAGGTR